MLTVVLSNLKVEERTRIMSEPTPNQTPQSTFGEKLQEAMYQNVQITELGNFPEAVPDHKNWVNIMGKVFSLDFNQASAAIKALVLEEIIGEDEEVPWPQDEVSRDRFYRKSGQNFLRNQQRSIITKGE